MVIMRKVSNNSTGCMFKKDKLKELIDLNKRIKLAMRLKTLLIII